MLLAIRTGAASAALLWPCAALAGSAGAVLQVGATVVRPVSIDPPAHGEGALRVRNAEGVNVSVNGALVVRSGGDIVVLRPARAGGASHLVVTIEY